MRTLQEMLQPDWGRKAASWEQLCANQACPTGTNRPSSMRLLDLFTWCSDRDTQSRVRPSSRVYPWPEVVTARRFLPRDFNDAAVEVELCWIVDEVARAYPSLFDPCAYRFLGGTYSTGPCEPYLGSVIKLRHEVYVELVWAEEWTRNPLQFALRPDPAPSDDEAAVHAARAARREARTPQKRSGPKVDLGPKAIER